MCVSLIAGHSYNSHTKLTLRTLQKHSSSCGTHEHTTQGITTRDKGLIIHSHMCKPQQNTRSYSTSVSRETNRAFHTSGFLKTNLISLLNFCEQFLKYLLSNIIISTGPILVTHRVANCQLRSILRVRFERT
jgi:hypothetical protein